MSPKETAQAGTKKYQVPGALTPAELLERARSQFYSDPNVIGVGIGERRVGGQAQDGQVALIVYVKEKLEEAQLDKEEQAVPVPRQFEGMGTDVVAPFGPDSPTETLGFGDGHRHSVDMMSIDRVRLHDQWTAGQKGQELPFQGSIHDYGDVEVIQDDGTLVQTVNGQPEVDYVRAYKLFRLKNPDIYDFVSFFTDTASGMPPQGGSSWYWPIHNDTQGIGYPVFSNRPALGTNKLQGILFLNQGHFGAWRYVMLQEQGHRWSSFAPYRDSQNGPNLTDHMLGGFAHWAAEFDDDRSPMDYDIYDWVDIGGGQYQRVSLSSDQREYSELDLYLMGAMGPDEVGDLNLLSNITNVSGNTYTANKKRLEIDNFLWANGARVPNAAAAQKQFKHGFCLLTKDYARAHDLADRIDQLRRRFEADFRAATKGLLSVDTTIGPLRREAQPGEITELTGGGYTSLHRHQVTPYDLNLTGVQYTGSIQPGQSQYLFTYGWSPVWHMEWSARPTTAGGKVTSSVEIERDGNGLFTYWITVRNTGSVATGYELHFARLR
ncbi:hypothetical protein [Streptomyces canus]|uniref:hypothetical protein n=1 Tax=Streptomyces canus TaxID=58343 RepID=UPI0036E52225